MLRIKDSRTNGLVTIYKVSCDLDKAQELSNELIKYSESIYTMLRIAKITDTDTDYEKIIENYIKNQTIDDYSYLTEWNDYCIETNYVTKEKYLVVEGTWLVETKLLTLLKNVMAEECYKDLHEEFLDIMQAGINNNDSQVPSSYYIDVWNILKFTKLEEHRYYNEGEEIKLSLLKK